MVVFALTLIRHGETSHNKNNVIQGQLDVPLSQTGLRQAELLGFHLQYQQYSHVYVSDLSRAMQTAESIIHQNKSNKVSLLHDCRLRERKFGAVEGKSFKFLKEVAEKSNQNSGQYTPPGGETIQQVHERAVAFFHDICEMVRERSKLEFTTDPTIDKINLNGPLKVENGIQCGQKRKWENGDQDKVQNPESPNHNNHKVCIKDIKEEEPTSISTHINSDNLSISDEDEAKDSSSDTDNEISSICNDVQTENIPKEDSLASAVEVSPQSKSNHKNILCEMAKQPALIIKQNGYGKGTKSESFSDHGRFSVMFSDEDIRSQIMSNSGDIPNIECPNVSLSPLVDQNYISSPLFSNSIQESPQLERRLSVCSSCDDIDGGPTLVANILVVSHGGWIRELFRYFVEDLDCSVPGGRKQALRISPNAGLSKFTISLEDQDGHPKIICLQIHDKQHLLTTQYPDKILNLDEVAP